ncbi:MAG: hypothetical protein R3F65_30045 [bacterium]
MANVVPDPIVMPSPLAALPGQPIRAAQVRYLLGCLNACTAHLHAGQAIQQQWAEHVAAFSGPTPEDDDDERIPLAVWRVPLPSPRHAALRVLVRASKSSDAGEVGIFVESVHAGGVVDADPAVGGADAWIDCGLLPIEEDAEEPWEEVRVYAATTGGVVGRLHQVVACYEPLGSPLAPTMVGGCTPFDLGPSVAVGRPLSAVRGRQILTTLAALLERPRVVQAWSDLDPAYVGVHASQRGMPLHRVRTRGPRSPGKILTFHARVADDAPPSRAGDPSMSNSAVIYAGAGAVEWSDRPAEPRVAGLLFPPRGGPDLPITSFIEMSGPRVNAGEVEAGPAWIRSLCIWGP